MLFRFVFVRVRAVFPGSPPLAPSPTTTLKILSGINPSLSLLCALNVVHYEHELSFFFVLLFVFFSVFSLVLSLLKQDLQDSKELNKKRNKEPVQV